MLRHKHFLTKNSSDPSAYHFGVHPTGIWCSQRWQTVPRTYRYSQKYLQMN